MYPMRIMQLAGADLPDYVALRKLRNVTRIALKKETTMAAYDANRPYVAAGSAGRIGLMFVQAFGLFQSWNDTRMTERTLASLSDRELADIGLHRGSIERVSRGR